MHKLKILSIANPGKTPEGWAVLWECVVRGFLYGDQVVGMLASAGYYVPEEQYELLAKAYDIEMDLAIGKRRYQTNET